MLERRPVQLFNLAGGRAAGGVRGGEVGDGNLGAGAESILRDPDLGEAGRVVAGAEQGVDRVGGGGGGLLGRARVEGDPEGEGDLEVARGRRGDAPVVAHHVRQEDAVAGAVGHAAARADGVAHAVDQSDPCD